MIGWLRWNLFSSFVSVCGLRWCLRSRSWTTAAAVLLDEVYAFLQRAGGVRGAEAGRLLLPPSWTGCVRRAGAGRRLLLSSWTRFLPSFASPGSVCRAGAGRLLLLPWWTRSTPSFALPGGLRRAHSWSDAVATLLDEVYAFLLAARLRGAGLLPLLPSWTQSTSSFLPTKCVRRTDLAG